MLDRSTLSETELKQAKKMYFVFRYHTNEKMRQYHIEYAKRWQKENPWYREYLSTYQKQIRKNATPEMKARFRDLDLRDRLKNPLKSYLDGNCNTLKVFVNRRPPNGQMYVRSKRGCTVADFAAYIEAHMLPGMTWADFRIKWTLAPVVKYGAFSESEKELAFHYSNFLPVWKKV